MESIKCRNALVLGFIRMKIQLFCIVALAAYNIRRSGLRGNPQKHDVVIHLMKKRIAEKKQANDNNYKTAWRGLEYTAMKQRKTDTLTC